MRSIVSLLSFLILFVLSTSCQKAELYKPSDNQLHEKALTEGDDNVRDDGSDSDGDDNDDTNGKTTEI